MALSMAAQEVLNENQRSDGVKIPKNSDVGGSQTQNPLAEDMELEVFTTSSIYCIKYALWRRLHVPIQNLSLALPGRVDMDLHNFLEIRQIINYEDNTQIGS